MTKFTEFCKSYGFDASEMTADQMDKFSDWHAKLCGANPDGSNTQDQENAEKNNLHQSNVAGAHSHIDRVLADFGLSH